MVTDAAVMADVVTAPQGHIVANLDKRLDGLVLENKTVVTNCCWLDPIDQLAGDVACQLVTHRFSLGVLLGPDAIDIPIAERDKQPNLIGWVGLR